METDLANAVTGGEDGAGARAQETSETIKEVDGTMPSASKPSDSTPSDIDTAEAVEAAGTCPICMDALKDPIFQLTCGHALCEECVISYVTASVGAGTIDPSCVYVSGDPGAFTMCGEKYSEEVISSLLQSDTTTLAKYSRLKFLRENKNGRECPKCEHLQIGKENNHEMVCDVCAQTYCFIHGGAHTGKTCEAYEEEVAEETSATNELLERNSKPCPGCGIYVSKSSGCNHMKCTQCKASFCWICGKMIGDDVFPNHFQWWNPTGCVNMQMNEELAPSERTIRMGRFMACLQVASTGLCTAISALASFLLCGCCCIQCRGSRQDIVNSARYVCGQHMTVWGGVWLFILVMSPAALLFGVCYFILTVLLVLLNIVLFTAKKTIAWYKRAIYGETEPVNPSHRISFCPLSIRINGNYSPPPAQNNDPGTENASAGVSADLESAVEELSGSKGKNISALTYGRLETDPDNVNASGNNLQRMEEGDSGIISSSLVVIDVASVVEDGNTDNSDSSVFVV